jgi:hypothetical protein
VTGGKGCLGTVRHTLICTLQRGAIEESVANTSLRVRARALARLCNRPGHWPELACELPFDDDDDVGVDDN